MPEPQRLAKKARPSVRKIAPAKGTAARSEAARFEAWLKDFDARQAALTIELDALLLSLGVTPENTTERQSA
jgi:hypothetical protein